MPSHLWKSPLRLGRAIGPVALGLAAIGLEAAWAVLRPTPVFTGHDASGSFGDPEAPPLRFTVLGDSTTTGPGVTGPEEIWISQLAQRLGDRFHVNVTSLAVGGARVADVRRQQVAKALCVEADVVFVSVGANDAIRGTLAGGFEAHLDAIVAALAARFPTVVLSGVGDLGTIPRLLPPLDRLLRARGRVFDRATARVAGRHGVVKVDMWGPATRQFRTDPEIFCPDLFHPTARGHALWADAVEEALGSRLELRGQS